MVPLCINPQHLEPVTGEENRRRYLANLAGQPTRDEGTQALAEVVAALVNNGVDRMHSADVLAALAEKDPIAYGTWDGDRLAATLSAAGVRRRTRQMSINGVNKNGWRLADLLARPA